jgi:hypothetical protein
LGPSRALACGLVAYLNRETSEIEGAYFIDPPGGKLPAHLPAEEAPRANWFDPFDFDNPYLWLGAGIGLALAGTVILLVTLRRT